MNKTITIFLNDETLDSFKIKLEHENINADRVLEILCNEGKALPCFDCQKNSEILNEVSRTLSFAQKTFANSQACLDLILK